MIAPRRLKKYNENEMGTLECLYKACQVSITDGGFFTVTDTGVGGPGTKISGTYLRLILVPG